MIKLVVSDIDGTLLEDGGHELNPELFDVILKLRAAGMQFAAVDSYTIVSHKLTYETYTNIENCNLLLSDSTTTAGMSCKITVCQADCLV